MTARVKTVTVELADRSYPIQIGFGLMSNAETSAWFKEHISGSSVVVVTNTLVAELYLESLDKLLTAYRIQHIILPDGESFKNMDSLNTILTQMLEQNQNRRCCMIALGGGVIGDMTGFAASCYQRGVDFIQVPTTLLSQVDSSVGGKTGVNHPLGKNMIGAFKQPKAVLIDIASLNTLPDREFAAGIAEVIKYGLIRDAAFFEWLESAAEGLKARQPDLLSYAIARSCEIKAEVVAADETEQNIRAILNLGHTFGHAIETYSGYGEWLHGEAVATGMLMAVSASGTRVSAELLPRLQAFLTYFNLPLRPPSSMTAEDFMRYMALDKKNISQQIRLVLLDKLGQAKVTEDYDPGVLARVLTEYTVG